MAAPHLHFLIEIYDMIIDELFNFHPALRACLSVSRCFRSRARCHLFSEIEIYDEKFWVHRLNHEKIHRRLKLLVDLMRPPASAQRNSVDSILPLIKSFNIGIDGADGFCSTRIDSNESLHSEILLRSREYSIDILQMLGTICLGGTFKFLAICGRGGDRVYWNVLAPAIRNELLHFIRATPSLVLKLQDVEGIPRHILRGTTVRHLIMDSVDTFVPNLACFDVELFPEYDENSTIVSLPLPALDIATTKICLHVLDEVYPLEAKHPHLSMRELHIDFEDYIHVAPLLKVRKSYPNLQVLSIRTEAWDFDPEVDEPHITKFNIRNMAMMERVEIDIQSSSMSHHHKLSSDFPMVLPCMLSLLESCRNPRVTTLSISFPMMKIELSQDATYDIDLNLFRVLDSSIGGSSNFPSLQSCTLKLRINPYSDIFSAKADVCAEEIGNQLATCIRQSFPVLRSSSLVTFTVQITFGLI